MRLAACAPPPKIWISGNGRQVASGKITPEGTPWLPPRHEAPPSRPRSSRFLRACACRLCRRRPEAGGRYSPGLRHRPPPATFGDAPIDVRDSAADVKSIGVPEVHRLARTRGCPGGRNRAAGRAGLYFHLCFHRGTASPKPGGRGHCESSSAASPGVRPRPAPRRRATQPGRR